MSLGRRGKRRLIVYSSLFIVYLLLVSCGSLADRLILFPSTEPLNAGRATTRRAIPWAGGEVEAWVARSQGARVAGAEPRAFVLEFTGNATRAEWIAEDVALRWGPRPVEVWAINYPGYGGSTGPARLKSIAPAALAAYDEMRRAAGDRPIFACGNSLGTTAALHVAANRPVTGMVLQNPPPLRSLILGRYGWWNLWLLAGPVAMQVPKDLDSLANAPRVTVPAVFIMADNDLLVAPDYQRKVLAAYAGEKRVIKTSGGHNAAASGAALDEVEAAIEQLWGRTVR